MKEMNSFKLLIKKKILEKKNQKKSKLETIL